MHLTLKQETTRPPRENLIAQQEEFDKFIQIYNFERPHAGIENKYPSEIYKPSEREFKIPEPLFYPMHDTVSSCGRICDNGLKISLSRTFAGAQVGIKEMEDGIWVVSRQCNAYGIMTGVVNGGRSPNNYKDFEEMINLAVKEKSKKGVIEIDPNQDEGLLLTSFIPWMSFTGLNEPTFGKFDSIPRVTWGKYNSDGLIPVSVQVHHALMDGVHVAEFFERLRKEIRSE